MKINISNEDALVFLKKQEDNSSDILFCDPPYALGSEIIISKDGKPEYKKAVDFMSKWDMPVGEFWEEFFKESMRVLKYGGHLLMYGIDRQNFLFKYYAHLARFTEKQSLYWYFISNFPKATDLSKMIDKNAGAEREKIKVNGNKNNEVLHITSGEMDDNNAITPLAKKYNGYKYSISPLKQVVEEIMVFQKPYKTGSCLHDVLEMKKGDEEIAVGALNIEGNRVSSKQGEYDIRHYIKEDCFQNITSKKSKFQVKKQHSGRYPAQAFIDSEIAEKLDRQSGIKKMNKQNGGGKGGIWTKGNGVPVGESYGDISGCSKILHKCDYTKHEYDIFMYNPKVSKKERNAGCENLKEKILNRMREDKKEPTGLNKEGRFAPIPAKNNHPTVKPIALNEKILRLFKTPNKQKILIPFAGSGSEIVGAYNAGFEYIKGCEINKEYIEIANARIGYWTKQKKLV